MPKISLDHLLIISNFAGWLSDVGTWGLAFDFPSCRTAREVEEKLFDVPGYRVWVSTCVLFLFPDNTVWCEGGSHI